MGSKNKKNKKSGKPSIFDTILEKIASGETLNMTPAQISEMIDRLVEMKKEARRKEAEVRQAKEAEEKSKKEEEYARQNDHVTQVTSMELPMDWENVFATDERVQGVHADSISDALIMSLSNLGRVDIEYISSITGEDCKTVICALKGSIYQNPDTWEECFYKGWETAEEYLSGNLMRKWKRANEANKTYRGYFDDNVKAIERVLPENVATKDIYVTIGSPWVPADIIDEFINHILKLRSTSRLYYSGTKHDEITGTWDLPNKTYYEYSRGVEAYNVYGTQEIGALHILERTLNMKAVTVTKEVSCKTTKSGKKRVVNQSETVLAIEKQQKLIEEFQKWVWKDEKRRERLEIIFENNFSCVRRRNFDGSFLQFPTMSPAVQLYTYQKNAVARILFSPNTLLAHDVGSGKTYVMIAAGMELKRMGLSDKNLYVVPNNIIGQWKNIFLTMYPHSDILCVEPKDFTPQKREATLKKIRDKSFDAVIMSYSCFERIPLSKQFYMDELERAKEKINNIANNKNKATSGLKRKKEAIEKALSELEIAIDDAYDSVYFDELGITRLFVDEAHNYKNVPVETKADRILGISRSGSKKCEDMMNKVHFVQSQNNGGGVVLATGTPITNSITDAFIMQKYLQSGELALLDLQSFDSWIGMFAEKVTEFEIDVDTNSYRLATRFSKFHNLPELTALLSSIADFHQVGEEAEIPEFDGYTDALIGRTTEFADYLGCISKRAEMVRSGAVSRKDDNMLKITTDGRKAALDLRLVSPTATFTYQSKVARCAENVYDIYVKTANEKSAQIIFCDTSTPKSGFNIYDELKRLLVAMGIPEGKIAYVHDAQSEVQRSKLFLKVRRGEVRVLLGSTFKLGLGVNVQDKLIALHEIDIPWRPADATQRHGRILRQGNQNKKVYIYRYITEGSFDAYSWQLLETKQRFIAGLLSGSLDERSGSDIEGTVLDYAEVKALAVGNPLVKQRVETANELTRYLALQRKAIETHVRLERELMELPAKIAHQEEVTQMCRNDLEFYTENCREYDKEERGAIREQLFEAVQSNILTAKERVALNYQGFDIVLPANMTVEMPYIWLQREGRYYLELGDSKKGGLLRIDNFLERFEEHLAKLEGALSNLRAREDAIKVELLKKEDYAVMIENTQRKLERLDKKLGVDDK